MATCDQRGNGWTAVLRRQPARMMEGRPGGGHTGTFEIICCDYGGHPGLDYSEVPAELRRVRGPYPIADGIAAYVTHVGPHQQPVHAACMGRWRMLADRR